MRFEGIVPKQQANTFIALICATMAVTFSQGLMIPWMASVEAGHISSLMNSLSTSDTYLGLLVAMVFVGLLSRHVPSIGVSRVYRTALPALTLPLVFGFMESALNGDLPLFAERVHMPLGVMSANHIRAYFYFGKS